MTSFKSWTIGIVASILIAGGIGCAALSNLVTPATIDKGAVKYAAAAGVIDANDFKGYANLDKAVRLKAAVDAAFKVKDLALNQMIEKNKLDYAQLSNVANSNMQLAQAREKQLFGPTGLLTMGLSLLGVGGLGGVIGLARKRPGDITPQEMEAALADVKGEVTAKDQQFLELVKGVQLFLNAHKVAVSNDGPNPSKVDDAIAVELKKALDGVQSVTTRQAVAAVKVTAA